MKNKWHLFIFVILFGCAGSPTRTAFEAEKHRMDMMDIKTNMSMDEVRDRMGVPKKIERRAMNGIEYEIWYYMTKGVNFDQTRLIDENFTPFVFYGTCLRGWGWKFYNHLFDINNARYRAEEDQKGGCYEPNEIKPDYGHRIITPYEGEERKSVEESLQELIKSGKEPAQKPSSTTTQPSTSPVPGQSFEVIQKPVPVIIEENPKMPSGPTGKSPSPSTALPGTTLKQSPTPPSSGLETSVPGSQLNSSSTPVPTTPTTNNPESGTNATQNPTPQEPKAEKFNWW